MRPVLVLVGGRAALGALAALMALASAQAHQLRQSVLTITEHPETGVWEVYFRIHMDDVDPASLLGAELASFAKDGLIGGDAPARHLLGGSALFVGEDAAVEAPLRYVGAELDGGFVWIYAEAEPPAGGAETLWVRHLGASRPDHHSLIQVRLNNLSLAGETSPASPAVRFDLTPTETAAAAD